MFASERCRLPLCRLRRVFLDVFFNDPSGTRWIWRRLPDVGLLKAAVIERTEDS